MGTKLKRGIVLGIILLLVGAGILTKINVKNVIKPVVFKNIPRNEQALKMDFYQKQLTQKEKRVYDTLIDRVRTFKGGIITLEEPMTKREASRISDAFFNDCGTYDYAYVFPIFVGEDDIAMTAASADNDAAMVSKIILLLSCSAYKNVELKFDHDTYKIMNLEEYGKALEVNDPEEIRKIKQQMADTDVKIQEIINGIPENAGQLDTLNYFCSWIGEHATYDMDTLKKLQAFAADEEMEIGDPELMSFVCNTSTPQSNIVGILNGKAICGGYAKTLAYLCNEAGIEAHVVCGMFKSAGQGHAITVVKIGDQVAYVDLSGVWSYLDGKEVKYRSEKATLNMIQPYENLKYQF